MDEVKIVLLGKQGAGKSASGNTLLGQNLFHTAAHTDRVTRTCLVETSTVDNQSIMVVDTPGWPDSLSETEIKQEIIKCIVMCRPHVFLLVLSIGRFTNEEINTVKDILKEFGNEALKHIILLFTKGDDLEGKTTEDYLKNIHQDLKNILEKCLGGYHVFNNRDKINQSQVSSLLRKINDMVDKNDKSCYTKIMDQNVKGQQREDEERSTTALHLASKKHNNLAEGKELETKCKIYNEPNERKESEKKKVRKEDENKQESNIRGMTDIEQCLAESCKNKQDKQCEHLEGHVEETNEKEREMMMRRGENEIEQLVIQMYWLMIKLEKNQQDMNEKLNKCLAHQG